MKEVMKPTEPNLWGIHAGKTGDADTPVPQEALHRYRLDPDR
jgi:hypothetical protein